MDLEIKRFEAPDDTRAFELGTFDLVTIAGSTLGRASYEPGWRWSTHVGAMTGEDLCSVEHVGIVITGRAAVRMGDGRESVVRDPPRARQLGRRRRTLCLTAPARSVGLRDPPRLRGSAHPRSILSKALYVFTFVSYPRTQSVKR